MASGSFCQFRVSHVLQLFQSFFARRPVSPQSFQDLISRGEVPCAAFGVAYCFSLGCAVGCAVVSCGPVVMFWLDFALGLIARVIFIPLPHAQLLSPACWSDCSYAKRSSTSCSVIPSSLMDSIFIVKCICSFSM